MEVATGYQGIIFYLFAIKQRKNHSRKSKAIIKEKNEETNQ